MKGAGRLRHIAELVADSAEVAIDMDDADQMAALERLLIPVLREFGTFDTLGICERCLAHEDDGCECEKRKSS